MTGILVTNSDKVFFPVALGGVLGCGLMAGIFFAFSAFVMKAFARLPADQGIAAMQSVNAAILNPVFFTLFFGTAVTCLLAIIYSVSHWQYPGAGWLLAGAALYLLGSFLVTVLFNVPMNDALAAVTPGSPDAASVWANYMSRWTAWNHVRTVAALAATASFALALHVPARY